MVFELLLLMVLVLISGLKLCPYQNTFSFRVEYKNRSSYLKAVKYNIWTFVCFTDSFTTVYLFLQRFAFKNEVTSKQPEDWLLASERSERDTLSRSSMKNAIRICIR